MDFPPQPDLRRLTRPHGRRASVAWAALIVSWAVGGIGVAAYLSTRPAVPARYGTAPAASAAVVSVSVAAAEAAASDTEAAAEDAVAGASAPAVDDQSVATGPWWLSQKKKTGDCTDRYTPAEAMLEAQGGTPWLKPNRDQAGDLVSVEVHSDDSLGTYITFFRTKADCDAFDIARFKRDCEKVNAEGYGIDCSALAREDPALLADTQIGGPP
jgi:hypothetical protein